MALIGYMYFVPLCSIQGLIYSLKLGTQCHFGLSTIPKSFSHIRQLCLRLSRRHT